MVEFRRTVTNPVFIAAFIVSFLVYSRIIPVKTEKPFLCLLKKSDITTLEGKISGNPVIVSQGKKYLVELNAEKANLCEAKGKIKVAFKSEDLQSLNPGKLYTVSRNCFLMEKGACVKLNVKYNPTTDSFFAEDIIDCHFKTDFWGKINLFRAKCRNMFKRLMYGWGKAGFFILSLLAGTRDYLDFKIQDDFKLAGLSHILALSGMHLSLVSNLSGKIGYKIAGKKYLFPVQLFSIIFFIWFAGLSPSLFRAFLCSFTTLFLSKISNKSSISIVCLCGAFLVHSVVFPEHLFSPAFMLSYGALLGIIVITPLVKPLFSAIIPPGLNNALCTSLAAQTATCSVTIKLFKTFTPIGIISSVVVGPLVTFFLTLATLLIFLCFAFPFMAAVCGIILNKLYEFIEFFVKLFASVRPIYF